MYRAILFDKDGTLTDFRATWEVWAVTMVHDLSGAAGIEPAALGQAVGVDVAARRLMADGPIVTAPFSRTLAVMAQATGWDAAQLRDWLIPRGAPDAVAVGRPDAVLADLRGRGLRLGVLTNDTRDSAMADLTRLGVAVHLDALVAADDGHGAKPAPHGALAFAGALGLAPRAVLVVGDGATDQQAAEAAGMDFVAVLTGTRGADGYPGARAVLPDIAGLPGWLDRAV